MGVGARAAASLGARRKRKGVGAMTTLIYRHATSQLRTEAGGWEVLFSRGALRRWRGKSVQPAGRGR